MKTISAIFLSIIIINSTLNGAEKAQIFIPHTQKQVKDFFAVTHANLESDSIERKMAVIILQNYIPMMFNCSKTKSDVYHLIQFMKLSDGAMVEECADYLVSFIIKNPRLFEMTYDSLSIDLKKFVRTVLNELITNGSKLELETLLKIPGIWYQENNK